MTLKKASSTLRYDIKAMILLNHGLPLSAENFKALDVLWDAQGAYMPERVQSILADLRKG